MAENPRFFTLAPWGYRILEPWIVHLLPASSAATGFFCLNLGLLSAMMYVTGAWLRRLGFSDAGAAIATSTFALSPPLRLLIEYQVLVDPLTLLLLLAMILYEAVDPDLLALAAPFAAVALTKEVGLAFLIRAPIALIPRLGLWRGALETCAVAASALGVSVLLRLTWGHTRAAGDVLRSRPYRRTNHRVIAGPRGRGQPFRSAFPGPGGPGPGAVDRLADPGHRALALYLWPSPGQSVSLLPERPPASFRLRSGRAGVSRRVAMDPPDSLSSPGQPKRGA